MKYYMIILSFLSICLLCGCSSAPHQDKAEVHPFETVYEQTYRKENLIIDNTDLSSPKHIASDGDYLYICDSGNSRIVKCTLLGEFVFEIGGLGTGANEFIEPTCIAVSNQQICIFDRGSNRIILLSFDGEPVFEYYLDDYFGFITEVYDVELSDNGDIYFSIIAFDKNTDASGVYLLKNDDVIQISSCTVGAFCKNESDILFASKYELLDDNSWISGYAELLQYNEDKCERISTLSNCLSAADICFYSNTLYIYDNCSQSVHIFDENGEYIKTVFSEPVVNDFSYNGFCCDKNGTFYLCDTKGNTVYKLVKDE